MQGTRSAPRSSDSSIQGSGSSSSTPGRRARGDFPQRSLPLAQITETAPQVVKVKRKREPKRRNALGSRCENFISWVPNDADGPQDLEEEERMERTTRLLDRYAVRKRKRQVSSSEESDVVHVQYAEFSQPASDD